MISTLQCPNAGSWDAELTRSTLQQCLSFRNVSLRYAVADVDASATCHWTNYC